MTFAFSLGFQNYKLMLNTFKHRVFVSNRPFSGLDQNIIGPPNVTILGRPESGTLTLLEGEELALICQVTIIHIAHQNS